METSDLEFKTFNFPNINNQEYSIIFKDSVNQLGHHITNNKDLYEFSIIFAEKLVALYKSKCADSLTNLILPRD